MENENKETLRAENADEDKKAASREKLRKNVIEWIVNLLEVAVVVTLLMFFAFRIIFVDGQSMMPTLNDREVLFATTFDLNIYNGLEKGDVVICHYPGRTMKHPIAFFLTVKTNFVKRIVGIPGDTVKRVSGVTYINDVPLDARAENIYRSYTYEKGPDGTLTYYMNGMPMNITDEETAYFEFDYEYVLGEDEYFCVGDNRYNSHDSRDWNGPDLPFVTANDTSGDVGPISKDMLVAHVRTSLWPLKSIRSIVCDPAYSAD